MNEILVKYSISEDSISNKDHDILKALNIILDKYPNLPKELPETYTHILNTALYLSRKNINADIVISKCQKKLTNRIRTFFFKKTRIIINKTSIKNNKIFKNTAWILIEQISQLLVGFIVTILVSRYFGPENYGILSYGTTLISLFLVLSKLGIDSIIISELIKNKDKEGEIIGTSIVLRIISSILSILLLILTVAILRPSAKIVLIISIIQSFSIIFRSIDIFDFWFQSKLASKYSSISKIISLTLAFILKTILILTHRNILFFAISTLLEPIATAIFLYLIYKKQRGSKLRFNLATGKSLLQKSYHFIISGLLIYVYTQIDKLMIGSTLGDIHLGYYSAALKVCTTCFVLSNSVFISLRTIIFKVTNKSYLRHLKQTYAILFWLNVIISFIITLASNIIIATLFGEMYKLASDTLTVLIWYTPLSILGTARQIWIIMEDKNRYAKKFALIGVVINILLNYIMIPIMGITGAALATIVTEFTTCFIAPMFFKETRKHTKILIEALIFKFDDELNLSAKQIRNKIIGKLSPKLLSKILYKERFGKKLNLKNPKNFNEKLMWLKLNNYAKNPLVWQCADKYRVREYIKSKGISEKYLPEIIKTYDDAKKINFDELPNKFALKCTHGCGFNIICTDKKSLNQEETIKKLNKWQKTIFGLDTAEPHYSHIKPIIICEKFIESEKYEWPIDYKLYCFNGKPELVLIHEDRKKHSKVSSYDTKWNHVKVDITETNTSIKKPHCIEKMLKIAKILSKDFLFVRIDFYEEKGEPIIGEMTFTPGACLLPWTEEALIKYGKMLKIEKNIK